MPNKTDYVSLVAMGAIMMAVGYMILFSVASAAVDSGEVQREYAEADAYCDQQFDGEYDLYNARAMFGHGGWHCEGKNGRTIHLHDVPEAAEEAALEATA